ncbi:hypothetical protein NE237_009241 [Protea cynaroides]|uniref:Secreted protein n=1 Tax=Protea cynaroides TaxID=273540 RepID=A0A9Q0KXF1_9MAGN|nr:hypothetical protein NE237_009241 [Protea cynaroides]
MGLLWLLRSLCSVGDKVVETVGHETERDVWVERSGFEEGKTTCRGGKKADFSDGLARQGGPSFFSHKAASSFMLRKLQAGRKCIDLFRVLSSSIARIMNFPMSVPAKSIL